MKFVRPGPSPAAPFVEATRAPSLSAPSNASGREGDEIEQRVDAVGMAVPDGGDDVAVTVEVLGDAELAQVVGVPGERRSDDRGTGAGSELDGKAADAAGRADDQDRVSLGERERIDGRECGDTCEWGHTRGGEVE